jgi:hypothetical protein
MSAPSPARRVLGRFMGFGLWTSAVAFAVIEGDALLDQSEIGHASTQFMFGTACLAGAACLGLFAIIMAIGLAVSALFSDEPLQQQSRHQDAAVANPHKAHLPVDSPALACSSSRRRRQPPRIHALARDVRKPPPQVL